jgi:S-adenosylmethionine decarboxylase
LASTDSGDQTDRQARLHNDISQRMKQFRDLAPAIHRQRLVIEGYPKTHITDGDIKRFLSRLSNELGMKELIEPVTHRSDAYGWAGWIHWETSGAHFYAWEQPLLFFSVDIYTCKPFDPDAAIDFAKRFFEASIVTAKEF